MAGAAPSDPDSDAPLAWHHPAHLIATWFGSGLLPKAPGTWGSAAALPFAAGLAWLGGPWLLLAASAMLFAIGIWASERYATSAGVEDPGAVVIDEVAGQWLALVPAATTFWLYLPGFIAFRLFDILKPWPASWADRALHGGWGIMLDDVIAGIYAALVVAGLSYLTG